MRRRNSAKSGNQILVMLIFGILSMNIIGIGYAYWNDTLSIDAEVTTGFIDPYFSDAVETDQADGRMDVIICDDDHTVIIRSTDGSVMGQDELRGFELHVDDRGSVPLELKGIKESNPDGIAHIIVEDGRIELEINSTGQPPGLYEFDYVITYESCD